MSATKKGIAVRTFRDAGTEKNFEGGKEHDFTPGEYDNFLHAGLIRAPEDKSAATAGEGVKPKP